MRAIRTMVLCRTMRLMSRVTLLLALVLSMSGCYGFRGGSVPAHLHTIYIPQADDASGLGRAEVRNNLTQTLIRKFRDDNSLRVVDGTGSDSRLDVAITTIQVDKRLNVSTQALGTVYGVVIQTRVTFFDNVKKKAIFKDRSFQAESQYSVSNPEQGRNDAINVALDNITSQILLDTVANW
jgi:hypothetical protein